MADIKKRTAPALVAETADDTKKEDFVSEIGISKKFAELFANRAHIRFRDLNRNYRGCFFPKYSKEDITEYLRNPRLHEKQLRDAVRYIYGASPHFRRVIQYFTGLTDFSYIVEPYKIDPKKANIKTTNSNYRKTLNALSSMGIPTQFPKILTVCLREDVFFGTLWVMGDDITIQQLPSDYCAISTIEGNVFNVDFDFSYFDSRRDRLEYYPEEFKRKYETYQKSMLKNRWQELDSPTSFAIKANADIPGYALPPFAGILREIYELEDYKILKMEKTEQDNYALLNMILPMDDDGKWLLDHDRAKDFWRNLDAVLPDMIGSVLNPMKIDKISFEKTNNGDADTIADAEQSLFTAAGVSSLLFNNPKASANALLLSIKADQCMTYGIVKSIGDMVNRFIQAQTYGAHFKVTFLDVSPFNRKEVGDAYLKAATYGIPTISAYAASQGIGQAELDTMSFLEGEVLGLQDMFRPIQSSSQMSSDDLESGGATDEGGAPPKDMEDLTESGEQNREDA